MKTALFLIMCALAVLFLIARSRRRPSPNLRSVDAIVPAYNEESCIGRTLRGLYNNPYIRRVICVNDGSTDGTAAILDHYARHNDRLIVVHQPNSGKGGAIMRGLQHVTSPAVFLTDADTVVPSDSAGIGHMLAEIERGADAVGGVPSSNLEGAALLPFIRATVKFPMIVVKRTFQQLLGGAPFIISGACGLFRTDVLRTVGLSDRTKVEDLDLSWELVARGYRVRQCARCVVYPQECNSLREDWRRWRRWITGYAVCMRLHRGLLLTRFGLFSILPMFAVVAVGLISYAFAITHLSENGRLWHLPTVFFPLAWLAIACGIGVISAIHQRRLRLIPLAPFAFVYVAMSYAVWVVHGLAGLFTGREPERDKPTRYANVVA